MFCIHSKRVTYKYLQQITFENPRKKLSNCQNFQKKVYKISKNSYKEHYNNLESDSDGDDIFEYNVHEKVEETYQFWLTKIKLFIKYSLNYFLKI